MTYKEPAKRTGLGVGVGFFALFVLEAGLAAFSAGNGLSDAPVAVQTR